MKNLFKYFAFVPRKLSNIFFLFLIITMISGVLCQQAISINKWRNGDGENSPLGTKDAADIDTEVFQKIVDPLDRLLADKKELVELDYSSASQVTVRAGSITCSNSDGSIRRMRQNTSDTTVTWSDLDTGSEASSTTYYTYAVADADATTFTCKISTSSTSPSGITYYKRIGSFYNNSSSDIEQVADDTYTIDGDDLPINVLRFVFPPDPEIYSRNNSNFGSVTGLTNRTFIKTPDYNTLTIKCNLMADPSGNASIRMVILNSAGGTVLTGSSATSTENAFINPSDTSNLNDDLAEVNESITSLTNGTTYTVNVQANASTGTAYIKNLSVFQED